MSRRRDRWVRWIGLATLVAVSPVLALAGTVAATGFVTVTVDERDPDGMSLWIPVPALAADLGIAAVDLLADDETLAEARRGVEPWLPALRDFAAALEDCPDATLVEVRDGDETVRIRKDGGDFAVDVRADDADVSVRLPARLVSRALAVLG